LIRLPAQYEATLLGTLSSVGADLSKDKPQLNAAYQLVREAAQRVH
jgi:hypothetical protein